MGVIVDIDPKDHSVEGHTRQCYLEFNGKRIWGSPNAIHCHDNTTQIAEALNKADNRFELFISERHHTVEGHIVTITISDGSTVYLDRLSTHDNMTGLRDAVRAALADDDK